MRQLFCVLVVLITAVPARVHSQALDSLTLLNDLRVLSADSMEGRRIGTRGNARARTFIENRLRGMGLKPVAAGFDLPFTLKQRGGGELPGVNIAAVQRGRVHPDRYIVVSAHYDHLGIKNGVTYNGADDNASGSAAVLTLAQWYKYHPPENSMLFVWFDGEESDLAGSKAFVDHPPVPLERIIANVNLDMVSRNVKGELYASGATPYPVMKPLLDSLKAVAPVKLMLGHDTGAGESNWIQQSDQGPFHLKKIPFVYFGVEDHPDYHKPTDKFEHIEPNFYYRCVKTISEFVRHLDLALDRVAASAGRR